METMAVNGAAKKEVKYDYNLIRRTLLGLGVKAAGGMAEKNLPAALKSHYEKALADEDEVSCDVCDEASDKHLDRCPFCGSLGVEGEVDSQPELEAADEEDEEVEPEPEPEVTSAKVANGKDLGGSILPTTLAKPEPIAMVDSTPETRLAKWVSELRELKRDWAQSGWKLGAKIAEGIKAGLWKHAKTSDGKYFKDFDVFIESLGFHRKHAADLARVSYVFTEKQFEEYGIGKLRLALRVPPESHAALLAEVKGKSTKQTEAIVSKLRDAFAERMSRPYVNMDTPGDKSKVRVPKKKTTPPVAKPETSEVTVALVYGKGIRFHLMAEEKGKDPRPAKKSDVGKEGIRLRGTCDDARNSVRLEVALEMKGDQVVAVLKPRRVDAG